MSLGFVMQEAVSRSTDVFSPAPVLVQVGRRVNLARANAFPSDTAPWRASLHVLSASFGPILFYTVCGLVGANILGLIVGALLLADVYSQSGGFLIYSNLQYPQLAVQGMVGLFTFLFARGAITWIALHGGGVRAAFSATVNRWPSLVGQSLVYGALITLGLASIVLLLRELRLDVSNVGRVSISPMDLARTVGIRALGSVLPDAGSPFSELLNFFRGGIPGARQTYTSLYYRPAYPTAPPELWMLGLGGAILIIFTETLFRLRTVILMRDAGPGPLSGLAESVSTGWRHFGYITGHVWALRMATVLIGIVFAILPTTFVQGLVVPYVARQFGGFWLYAASNMLFTFAGTLAGMLLLAYSIVYDTRLYMAVKVPGAQHDAMLIDKVR